MIREEVFASASGFDAATPASIVVPQEVALFVLLVTLDPIPEVILTFHGIITFITQGREPSKVTSSKQIIGTAYHLNPPQMIGFEAFVHVIHNVYKGIHTSL